MISNGYSLLEQAGSLMVLWMAPSLPLGVKFLTLAFLSLLPFVFLFRGPIAALADRHLHIHLSPRTYGIGAPLLSILCGLLLIYFRPVTPLIRWYFNEEGIMVNSLNNSVSMKWSDVVSASFDLRNPNPDQAALVLKSKEGRELWLILSWLRPTHREKVMVFIKHSIPGRFNLPVSSSPPASVITLLSN